MAKLHFLTAVTLITLLGCASSDNETQQTSATIENTPPTNSGQKAYIDPDTGELTSPPIDKQPAKQNRAPTSPSQPFTFDTEVKPDGTIILVPQKPANRGLKAHIDCDGSISTNHSDGHANKSDLCAFIKGAKEAKQ